jgi:hypothetical protein
MSERLSDLTLSRLESGADVRPFDLPALVREVQMWRALVYGGPCECMTRSMYSNVGNPDHDGAPDECPDCYLGRKPGVVERLEALNGLIPSSHSEYNPDPDVQWRSILADLRAAGNHGGPSNA